MTKKDDSLQEYEEDIETLLAYFLISTGIGIVFFILYLYIKPSAEEIKRSDSRSSLVQRADVAKIMQIAAFTSVYYSISISFTIFNKWFLNYWEGGFSFPITTTAAHMVIKFILSRICALHPDIKIEPVSYYIIFSVIIPIGSAAALDVMLSNSSLLYINLSTFTIIKSTTVVNVYILAIIYGLEIFRCDLTFTLIFIVIGVALAVHSTMKLSTIGIGLCFGATIFSALKSVLAQFLFKVDPQCKNVLIALYHVAPYSAVCLIPFAYFVEFDRISDSKFFHSQKLLEHSTAFIIIGGIIAFWLILLEFTILNLTSSLTMSVLAHLKEVLQIILAVIIFRDQLTEINIAGLILCSLSIAYYKYLKYIERMENIESSYLPLPQNASERYQLEDHGTNELESLQSNTFKSDFKGTTISVGRY